MAKYKKLPFTNSGFTIVELLVIIAVICILVAITIVSYDGFTEQADIVSLQSDLNSASKQLSEFQARNGVYPTTIDCTQPDSATNKCVRASTGNTYTYNVNNSTSPRTFGLTAKNVTSSYRITQESAPIPCPQGFIVVPGSTAYGTEDFCVMKYEARQVDVTDVPISTASELPWASVSQIDAIAYSPNVTGCIDCHLVNEAEWLTIAQNVLSVSTNWSGEAVGSGYIYSGHTDSTPFNRLAVGIDDTDGYAGTLDDENDLIKVNNMEGKSQRRTLTLTNGEVIWDFSGNLWETGPDTIGIGQQPGFIGDVTRGSKDWNDPLLLLHGFPATSVPSYGTPEASGWNYNQGIGRIMSNYNSDYVSLCIRGAGWDSGTLGGVLMLYLGDETASQRDNDRGFRVSA